MATQKRTTKLLPGSATHIRTERDYMAVLLDEVDTDTWREVIQASGAREGFNQCHSYGVTVSQK